MLWSILYGQLGNRGHNNGSKRKHFDRTHTHYKPQEITCRRSYFARVSFIVFARGNTVLPNGRTCVRALFGKGAYIIKSALTTIYVLSGPFCPGFAVVVVRSGLYTYSMRGQNPIWLFVRSHKYHHVLFYICAAILTRWWPSTLFRW